MKNKRKNRYLALLLLAAVFLAGCTPNSSAVSTPATSFTGHTSTEEMTLLTSTITDPAAVKPLATPGAATTPSSTVSGTPVTSTTATTEPKTYESDLALPPPGFTVDYTRTDLNRSVRSYGQEYTGKLIDTHTHVSAVNGDSLDTGVLEDVITALNQANVEYIIVMPVPNQQVVKNRQLIAEQYATLLEMGGNCIKLFLESGFISKWLNDSYANGSYDKKKLDTLLTGLDSDIQNPDCSGIGEIGLYHFNKTGNQPVIAYPPTFAPFLDVISKIVNAGLWLDLHAEPVDPDGVSYEDEVFGGLALLYQQFPDLKVILSHTAMTNPTNARRILETYPNVMMNFKPVTDHDDWRNLEPVTDTRGYLYEDWAALFEEMPERFMVGSDMKFGLTQGNDISVYNTEISLIRQILGSIDPEAAEMIAYKNAERIFQ